MTHQVMVILGKRHGEELRRTKSEMDHLQKELAEEVKKVEKLKQAAKRSERQVKDSGTRQLDSGTLQYRILEWFQKTYEEAERGWGCFSDYRSPC